MREDSRILVPIPFGEALSLGRRCFSSRWGLFLSVWGLTGLAGLLMQDLFLPTPAPWNGGEESLLPLYLFILVTATLLGLLGMLIIARVAGAYANGESTKRGVKELRESLKLFVPLLLSGVLASLRIMLVAAGSLPLVLLLGFFLYGAAQGALSETVERTAVGAPILLFAIFGFARFGWAIYFTIIEESGPVAALRKSKSLFANNRTTIWILTAIVLSVPVIVTLVPILLGEQLPRSVFRVLRYLSSLWTFSAVGLVAVVIAKSYEQKDTGTGVSDVTPAG
jgi:hypothetical protein